MISLSNFYKVSTFLQEEYESETCPMFITWVSHIFSAKWHHAVQQIITQQEYFRYLHQTDSIVSTTSATSRT